MRFCESCNADMLAADEGEESDMFQSGDLDEERPPSKITDGILMTIAVSIALYAGGLIWFIAAGIIYFVFRKKENSWLYFVVPWILLRVIAYMILW